MEFCTISMSRLAGAIYYLCVGLGWDGHSLELGREHSLRHQDGVFLYNTAHHRASPHITTTSRARDCLMHQGIAALDSQGVGNQGCRDMIRTSCGRNPHDRKTPVFSMSSRSRVISHVRIQIYQSSTDTISFMQRLLLSFVHPSSPRLVSSTFVGCSSSVIQWRSQRASPATSPFGRAMSLIAIAPVMLHIHKHLPTQSTDIHVPERRHVIVTHLETARSFTLCNFISPKP